MSGVIHQTTATTAQGRHPPRVAADRKSRPDGTRRRAGNRHRGSTIRMKRGRLTSTFRQFNIGHRIATLQYGPKNDNRRFGAPVKRPRMCPVTGLIGTDRRRLQWRPTGGGVSPFLPHPAPPKRTNPSSDAGGLARRRNCRGFARVVRISRAPASATSWHLGLTPDASAAGPRRRHTAPVTPTPPVPARYTCAARTPKRAGIAALARWVGTLRGARRQPF